MRARVDVYCVTASKELATHILTYMHILNSTQPLKGVNGWGLTVINTYTTILLTRISTNTI